MLHSAPPLQNRPNPFPLGGPNAPRGILPSQAGLDKTTKSTDVANAAERITVAAKAQEVEKNKISGVAARLINLTQDLTKLLREENVLLEKRLIGDISPLQNEKVRLTTKYELERDIVKKNPSALGPKDSMARQKLKEVTKFFQDELVQHGRTLIRMKSITEGMVESINAAVSKKRPVAQQYNSLAGMNNSSGLRPNAIAINQVI
jgi:hypothetical protein